MKLLLDTHIWLWSLLEPARIDQSQIRILTDPANTIWLSPISLWELTILVEKNRLTLDRDLDGWVAEARVRAPINDVPLTAAVALATRHVDLSHRDPADRFLAATARVFNLHLVTADQRLLQGRGYRTLGPRGTAG